MTPVPAPLARVAGAVPGVALAAGLLATALVRRDKPLHPIGIVGDGVLRVTTSATSGVPLLDTPAEVPVLVRWSRAMGRDPDRSDIEGLALRFGDENGPADVLFASTGSNAVARHLLVLRAPGEHATVTTLLPVATGPGSLLMRLEPLRETAGDEPPAAYELSWSRVGRPWQTAGVLEVSWREGDDDVRFDPVLHQLPGTRQYAIVAALREPAYRAGRTVRARAEAGVGDLAG